MKMHREDAVVFFVNAWPNYVRRVSKHRWGIHVYDTPDLRYDGSRRVFSSRPVMR